MRPPVDVCSLSRDAFVARFGGVFEHAPWVAEEAFDAGLDAACADAAGLHARLCAVVRAAPERTILALLRAHPDLAGRLALAGDLTPESTREQQSAGLDRLSRQDFARFTTLNAAYVSRFGFPFIIAVRGLSKDDILRAFEARVDAAPAAERATALAQVERIAFLRLKDLFA